MIICDSNNIDIIQGIIGYGNVSEGITDWRIINTNNGIFNILNSSSIIRPSGGTSEIGEIAGTTDRYMIFKQGTSTFYVPPGGIICDLLVVGGGGGGGGSGGIYENGGGGGGGIVYMVKKTFESGTYNVIVGNGGAVATVGGDSSINLNNTPISFDGIPIVGKGGGMAGDPGGNGGSGGGGNYQLDYIYDDDDNIIYFNNYGTSTQGNTFWDGTTYVAGGFNGQSGSRYSGGGGGGAAEAGGTDFPLKGGDGRAVSITGTSVFYGGGGGGADYGGGTQGGNGGGGSGNGYGNGIPGTPNTGGGGGGSDLYYSGGAGGSGIIIIRYSTIPNISIIENGNIGIGITPVIGSSKMEIIGDINISGIYKKNNRNFVSDTSNYILSTNNILTNNYKLTGGNGINISETLSPVISSTQWTTLGDNIYNSLLGAVSINYPFFSSSELIISENSATPGFTYMPFKIFAGAYSDTGNGTATLIDLGTQYSSYSKCAIGHCRTNTFDRGAIVFLCNDINDTSTVDMVNEAMRIDMNGNVGIGKTNPAFNLEIGTGIGGFTTRSRTYMNADFNYLRTASGSWGRIGFIANSPFWATTSFNTGCDIRIKEELHDIIDDRALQIILAIKPKTYKYIDKVFMGDKRVYGFIAQQIREVIPEAVNIQMSYIPNIMLLANYNNNIITFSLQPNYVIKYNDKIKCYDKNNKEIFVVVEEIINVLTFRIKELDNIYTDASIFVYGSEVEDFHTLDKNYIFTLNVCAIQELNRRIEAQNAIIINHEKRINELKAKVSFLLNIN